jgi:hypothetical protein
MGFHAAPPTAKAARWLRTLADSDTTSRSGAEGGDLRAEHGAELGAVDAGPAPGVEEAREEVRVAAGVAQGALDVDGVAPGAGGEELGHGLAPERLDRHLDARDARGGREEVVERAAPAHAVAPVGHDGEHRRRRAHHELEQHAHAVVVGPLQIVDEDDDRVQRRHAPEELAQGVAGGAAGGVGAAGGGGAPGEARQLAHALEHREHLHQGEGAGRGELGDLVVRAREQVVAQGVDHAVEALERQRLRLVAAAVVEARAPGAGGGGEGGGEGRLAHARQAVDGGEERAVAGALEGAGQEGELGLAAHGAALAGVARSGGHGDAQPPAGGLQAREHVVAAGTRRRVGREEAHRELLEIRRLAAAERRVARGWAGELGAEDLALAAVVGQAPGEGLVEHDAERVPVARLARIALAAELGRHVRRRARDGGDADAAARAREAEVEQHHASGGLDQGVRRLDVAVQAARAVQRRDGEGELGEARAQALGRARHVLAEGKPGDELHGEVPLLLLAEELEELDQVGMRQVGDHPELALEAVEPCGIRSLEALERDQGAVLPVARLVDVAEAALAQLAAQLVALGAGLEPGWGVTARRGGDLRQQGVELVVVVHVPPMVPRSRRRAVDLRCTICVWSTPSSWRGASGSANASDAAA